jgi:hypothetical protein
MFSLIITIISIALVAALALATLYFGGDAFNQGSAKAAAATVVNQAQQINGANTLHYLDNQTYGDLAALTGDDYLASAPNPGSISASDYSINTTTGVITLDGVKSAVCDAINTQAGLADRPADEAAAAAAAAQFSCFGAAGADGTFYFK